LRVRLLLAAAAGIGGLLLLLFAWSQRSPSVPIHAGGAQPRVCLVGPLPPPSGGMANQCDQLLRLLRADGVAAAVVRTNAPYRPAWAGHLPVVRAAVRLLPYLVDLWRAYGRCDVVHLLANSGWAWHLFAAPALWIARLRGRPVIVNYRGGMAGEFLAQAPAHVLRALRGAALLVLPSDFLRRVFEQHGLHAELIPNIVDTGRFVPRRPRAFESAPHIVVARNLEPIYGLDTAIRALALLRRDYPGASLTLAGSGPQRTELLALAAALGLSEAVHLPGRIDHADMPALYSRADVALNPSTVDNMPNSVLEAYASRLPVVSTRVGGVADIVDDGVTGLLVPANDPAAMAHALCRVLDDPALAERLAAAGHERVAACSWPRVRQQWLSAYRRACGREALA
jgi:glycosyltransferase involved in cell wall biosynthesis